MPNPKFAECHLAVDFSQGFEDGIRLCYVDLPQDAKILKNSFSPNGQTFLAIYPYQARPSFSRRIILIAKQQDKPYINLDLEEINHLTTVYCDAGTFHIFEKIK